MKMFKPSLCCPECFSQIATRSTAAARLWLDICELEPRGGIELNHQDSESIWLLENMGFITTTETPDGIMIRVNHRQYVMDEETYLVCNGKWHA